MLNFIFLVWGITPKHGKKYKHVFKARLKFGAVQKLWWGGGDSYGTPCTFY